eukprot:CAMPEP_0117419022 /NCGR_PEP_ID=MMETSP0758-20121206/688_1 /TAXON_ID=63605 /ORGANISM="Percolomonas cosmopolitus, Strain AE-1 (ATCC 50343)" /LENGTH=699 /DNA_ID=CAMNT_0005199879 /DNA_START=567 /DNA_END=2663 /DNA_ORIENTATION=-
MKIWDLRNFKCLQTIKEKSEFALDDRLSAIHFNEEDDTLVLGSNKMIPYPMQRNFSQFKPFYVGLKAPVTGVLIQEKYNHVVTVGVSTYMVWELYTGKKLFTHDVHKRISHAAWDSNQRRLVLSLENGDIQLYNYINGQHLKYLCNSEQNEEIRTLECIDYDDKHRWIVGGGVESRIFMWNDMDDNVKEEIQIKSKSLPQDILCSCAIPPNILAVGCNDGSIAIVDYQTGSIKKICPYEPPPPDLIEMLTPLNHTASNHSSPTFSNVNPDDANTILAKQRQIRGKINSYSVSMATQCESLCYLKEKSPILISTSGNGIVTFWDYSTLTRLLSIKANPHWEAVTTSCVSENNYLYFTGDVEGFVNVYDISRLPTTKPGHVCTMDASQIRLLYRFRAHVNNDEIVESFNMIITGSDDCTCALNTINGLPIGYFGQSRLWNIRDRRTFGKVRFPKLLLKNTYSEKDLPNHPSRTVILNSRPYIPTESSSPLTSNKFSIKTMRSPMALNTTYLSPHQIQESPSQLESPPITPGLLQNSKINLAPPTPSTFHLEVQNSSYHIKKPHLRQLYELRKRSMQTIRKNNISKLEDNLEDLLSRKIAERQQKMKADHSMEDSEIKKPPSFDPQFISNPDLIPIMMQQHNMPSKLSNYFPSSMRDTSSNAFRLQNEKMKEKFEKQYTLSNWSDRVSSFMNADDDDLLNNP